MLGGLTIHDEHDIGEVGALGEFSNWPFQNHVLKAKGIGTNGSHHRPLHINAKGVRDILVEFHSVWLPVLG